MKELLSVRAILDMAHAAKKVAADELSPKEFFARWPDLSVKEDGPVLELWLQMQYFENDIVHAPESAEYYRDQVQKYAKYIEERFTPKLSHEEESG